MMLLIICNVLGCLDNLITSQKKKENHKDSIQNDSDNTQMHLS